jgi:hypothetical protein
MTLQGYVDDSGSEPSSQTIVLAGYVLPASAWLKFTDDWNSELLRGRPIKWLHMKDTGQHAKKGEFVGCTLDQMEAKLLPLANIIKQYQPIALTCHAEWAEYEKFKNHSKLAKFVPNPYKVLFYEIIKIMYGFGKRKNNLLQVDFVFDRQGPVGTEACSWYEEFKAALPPTAKPFFGATPRFEDDTKVLPLQAADMFAWYLRRRITKRLHRAVQLQINAAIAEYLCADSTLSMESFEAAAADFFRIAKS